MAHHSRNLRMKIQLASFLERFSSTEPVLRKQDLAVAKRYIKARLKIVYPHLRGDPIALEAAYQKLDIQLSEVETDVGTVIYELMAPDDHCT